MRFLLAPFALLLLSARDETTALRFAPDAGSTLRRTFVAEAEFHLAGLSVSVDGEPLESPEDLPSYTTNFREHIEVLDVLQEIAAGRPTAFTRQYEVLRQENTETLEGEEASNELSSPLQGRRVLYTYDEDEDRYLVTASDDGDLDEDLADWLAADMDLLLLLPEGEVAPGDEWVVAPNLYLAFMWPGGLLDFHRDEDEVTEEERESSRQTIRRLAGSGTARLEEVRDSDDSQVAVIHLELEITTGSEYVWPASEDGLEKSEVAVRVEIERKMVGTVLWDVEHGHALSAELECQASQVRSETFTTSTGGQEEEEEGMEVEVEGTRTLEGTIRYGTKIEHE